MAAPSSSGFPAYPIHQAGHNELPFAADPIYQAAVAASVRMFGATWAPPSQQDALMAPPPPQGSTATMDLPMTALQPPQAESTMGPPMTATQLLLAVEMIARLPPPTASLPVQRHPDYIDMPSGQQMTGREQEMAGFNESLGLPYVAYIHNEIPSVESYEHSLPSNASNTLYVEGLPSNCTIRELTHIFRPFTGLCNIILITRGSDNRHATAFVDFDTPVQAFSAMESLQGYLFDINDLYSYSLHLQFSPPCPRSSSVIEEIAGINDFVYDEEIEKLNAARPFCFAEER